MVGETHRWLNPSLSCMELSTAGRQKASEMVLVYLKVKIVFALAILTTHLLVGLCVCVSEGHIQYEVDVIESEYSWLFPVFCMCIISLSIYLSR